VPQDFIARFSALCEKFFASTELKAEVKMPYPGYPYGYASYQSESLAQSLDRTMCGPKNLFLTS